jgi:enoyl-CoA hydratase
MTRIQTKKHGRSGEILLDRPKALNALTTDMCIDMTAAMLDWRGDEAIGHIVVDGAGDRAFCAGGDVVMLHDSGKAKDGRAEEFWRTEYRLNVLIDEYPKPYIALIDGIVMGGGVGLSVHGDFRVAGDDTLFAMPETGIGYFPDVGGTWFLPRLGEAVGNWLGLTGARLGPAECFHLGVATHIVPTDQHGALKAALSKSDDVAQTLADFHVAPTEPFTLPDGIEAFLEADVPAMIAALDANGSEWAKKQAKSLRRKSPLALAATLESLRRGMRTETFREAMARELDISVNFLGTQDFYEGIRAQLIDKDRNPKWSHAFGDVTRDQVERLFRPATAALDYH